MDNDWIFEFEDYRQAIVFRLAQEGRVRGYRSRLARAAGCQLAYFSHVLNSDAHFTPDQAIGICEFWAFDDLETDYFMNLVQLARAATPRLSTRIQKVLLEIKRQHGKSKRSRLSHEPYAKEKVIDYYLDWVIAVTHAFLTLPDPGDNAKIARRLGVDERRVQHAFSILQELGFAEKNGLSYRASKNFFHAADENQYASLHHRNWRHRVQEQLSRQPINPASLHYTAIHSLSVEDVGRIRSILQETIAQTRALVAPSPEETVACITLDWWEI